MRRTSICNLPVVSISIVFILFFVLIFFNSTIHKIELLSNIADNSIIYIISAILQNFITPLTLIALSIGLLSFKKIGWYVSLAILIILLIHLFFYFFRGIWEFDSTQYNIDFYQLCGKYFLSKPIMNFLFHFFVYLSLMILLFTKELRKRYLIS